MNTPIDIETIPGQGLYESFLAQAKADFKAPSSLTKEQAAKDLGMTDTNEIKFTSKDSMIQKWIERFSEEKAPEVAEENWRKTALDGSKGELFSIAYATGGSGIACIHRAPNESERELLQYFFTDMVARLNGRPPFFIAHNAKFDLKFLFRRAVILGVKPPFSIPFRGRHDSDYFCTSEAFCEYGERISLNNLCAALGIKGKPDDIDGSNVWDYVKAGNYEKVTEYNKHDVFLVQEIYNKLTFRKAA